MGKSMARLDENNIVINIEWYSINTQQSDFLVNTNNYAVSPGDTYCDGRFYHNGEKILSEIEYAYSIINEYESKEEELNNSYQEGINSI